jgi:hypothetical protein
MRELEHFDFRAERGKPAAKSKVDRNCTHLAGEYFVAAELYRRGYSVAITIGNAKAIDLFADRGTRTVRVQVRAIRDKRNVGWPMMRNRVVDGVIYVFVCLNEPGNSPDYFICTPDEARENTAQYTTRGIIGLRKLRRPEYQERWDKLEQSLTMPAARRGGPP